MGYNGYHSVFDMRNMRRQTLYAFVGNDERGDENDRVTRSVLERGVPRCLRVRGVCNSSLYTYTPVLGAPSVCMCTARIMRCIFVHRHLCSGATL